MLKKIFYKLVQGVFTSERYTEECWTELEQAYSHESRSYHNLRHLECMMYELQNVNHLINNIELIQFAVFYHDIVYDATKEDNEYQSALLLEKRMSPLAYPYIQECKKMITATKFHAKSNDSDTNYFLDIDLTILGQPKDVYSIYTQQIRKEYNMFSDVIYTEGRKKVLQHFLESDTIYHTPYFREKYEVEARKNLQHELLTNF